MVRVAKAITKSCQKHPLVLLRVEKARDVEVYMWMCFKAFLPSRVQWKKHQQKAEKPAFYTWFQLISVILEKLPTFLGTSVFTYKIRMTDQDSSSLIFCASHYSDNERPCMCTSLCLKLNYPKIKVYKSNYIFLNGKNIDSTSSQLRSHLINNSEFKDTFKDIVQLRAQAQTMVYVNYNTISNVIDMY